MYLNFLVVPVKLETMGHKITQMTYETLVECCLPPSVKADRQSLVLGKSA